MRTLFTGQEIVDASIRVLIRQYECGCAFTLESNERVMYCVKHREIEMVEETNIDSDEEVGPLDGIFDDPIKDDDGEDEGKSNDDVEDDEPGDIPLAVYN